MRIVGEASLVIILKLILIKYIIFDIVLLNLAKMCQLFWSRFFVRFPDKNPKGQNEGKKEKFPGMEDFFPLLFEFEFEFKTKFGLGFDWLHITDWTKNFMLVST